MTSKKDNHIKTTQKRLFYNMFYFKTKLSVKLPEKSIKNKERLHAAVSWRLIEIPTEGKKAKGKVVSVSAIYGAYRYAPGVYLIVSGNHEMTNGKTLIAIIFECSRLLPKALGS